MQKDLLKRCGDKIEVLYQPRRGVSATTAWQRLQEELALVTGTEAEQRFLNAAELATVCRRHNWPVWLVGSGPSSILLFLLELSQVDPIENGLYFERFFFPHLGQTADFTLVTPETTFNAVDKTIAAVGANKWLHLQTATQLQALPAFVEDDLRKQGKAVDWGREPTNWPVLWDSADPYLVRTCEPDIYQLDCPEFYQAKQAWQPGSPSQLAAITAIALQSALDEVELFTWAQERETPAELLRPWLRESGGILIFQEQVMASLHEIGGFSRESAYRALKDITTEKTLETDAYERKFLDGAMERGHAPQAAWLAFDAMREAAATCVCKAHHVAQAITTYRALWLRSVQPTTYRKFIPAKSPDYDDD